jgi:hypothetical protein
VEALPSNTALTITKRKRPWPVDDLEAVIGAEDLVSSGGMAGAPDDEYH